MSNILIAEKAVDDGDDRRVLVCVNELLRALLSDILGFISGDFSNPDSRSIHVQFVLLQEICQFFEEFIPKPLKMQNDAGEFVDLYVPRKCTASNRIIHAKDHASIQINLADVDESTGRMLDTVKTYAICGDIRRMGESDDCINRLAKKDGLLAKNF